MVIFILNFIGETADAIEQGDWSTIIGLIVILGVLGFIAVHAREQVQGLRQAYRARFQQAGEKVGLRDAILFSLTWSREIYDNIPADRKPLVRTAFLMIAIGMGLLTIELGFTHLLTILIAGLLILAAINLLIWIVTEERGQMDILRFEVETARRMQLSLMPSANPELDGFDIAGMCRPANTVGGDHFDYARLGGREALLGIAVVDVAGKGMDAAMTAVFTSGALANEVQRETDPAVIMNRLNMTVFSRNNKKKFVSFLLGALDATNRTFTYVNAGQSRPLLYHDSHVETLIAPGPRFPLGVVPDTKYRNDTLALGSGDALLLFTDGLVEAMNSSGEPLGQERLQALFQRAVEEEPGSEPVLRGLVRHVELFTGNAPQHDDLTAVVIKVL